MASTLITESRSSLRERRNPVPLLLSSFPVPPSHIPASPYTPLVTPLSAPLAIPSSSNPPPSLPPSSPLPPVPGPSPITEHDTLLFISAARSRRASKLSIGSSSTYSRRNSTATLASNASGSNSLPSLSSSVSVTPVDSSVRSLRSYSSNGSLSVPSSRHTDKSPVLEPKICEEDAADLTRMSLDEIPAPSPMPDPGLSDDEQVSQLDIPSSHRSRHSANDSISSIDMRDLPPLQGEPDFSTAAPAVIGSHRAVSASHISSESSNRSMGVIHKELPPLPAEASTSSEAQRADSPDIKTILAITPRPRRKSSTSCMSGGTQSPSRSCSRAPARRALRRHASEGIATKSRKAESGFRRTSEASLPVLLPRGRPVSPTELAYARRDDSWNEDSFVTDYGVPLDATGTPMEMFDHEEEERLERELEGDGSDTDSSIDIHTPLPDLMLRDGLLSPNSKLLSHASGKATPQLPNARPGSLMSIASTVGSVMTKSGLYKDERNTARRRHRHRDGKMLRGGIGLTTGLGWSDSEDEDAPSPLTRKISSSALQTPTTRSSLSRPHPLSRAYSAASLGVRPLENSTSGGERDEKSRSSHLSSSYRTQPSRVSERRTSSSSTGSSSLGLPRRTSLSSLRSVSSSARITTSTGGMLTHINEKEENIADFPSSSSSSSVPMPPTPLGFDTSASSPAVMVRRPRTVQQTASRTFETRMQAAGSTFDGTSTSQSRTQYLRPLKLPQSQTSLRRPHGVAYAPMASVNGDDDNVSVRSRERVRGQRSVRQLPPQPDLPKDARLPPISTRSGVAVHSPQPPPRPSAPEDVSSRLNLLAAEQKQKPRTGTGMTYRTSSTSGTRPSMMRMPSSNRLRTPHNGNIGTPF